MCSCLCFCHWCVVIISCNWKLFKLLSTITCLSLRVVRMHICIFMKTQEIITWVKHVYHLQLCLISVCRRRKEWTQSNLRASTQGNNQHPTGIAYLLFFFHTSTSLRASSQDNIPLHWHCLSSFTFTPQQVYLLLLLLLH